MALVTYPSFVFYLVIRHISPGMPEAAQTSSGLLREVPVSEPITGTVSDSGIPFGN